MKIKASTLVMVALVAVAVTSRTKARSIISYPGGKGRVSRAQVRAIAADVGWPAHTLPTVERLAIAESSGMIGVRHLSTKEDSRGLMQINLFAHPWAQRLNLYDPVVNLRAALRVYNEAGRSFGPWSTYK